VSGMETPSAMDRIRAEPGLLAEIARRLGVTRAAVAKWKQVPPLRVLAVEAISGISRHDLRPDIYPRPFQPRRRSSKSHNPTVVSV
jgi:DNA-binding transcriptional regulator YdaS (Cro superfamily)